MQNIKEDKDYNNARKQKFEEKTHIMFYQNEDPGIFDFTTKHASKNLTINDNKKKRPKNILLCSK